jgi:CHRD domain
MIRSAKISTRTLTTTFILLLSGCGGGSPAVPPQPKPAKPAVNPFQAYVRAHAFALTLTPAAKARSGPGPSAAAVINIAAGSDRVCWNVTRLSGVADPMFAYIHRANGSDSGPVVIPLGAGYKPSGCVTSVAPALLADIEAHPGHYYLAIHNRAHPLGAIRGSL